MQKPKPKTKAKAATAALVKDKAVKVPQWHAEHQKVKTALAALGIISLADFPKPLQGFVRIDKENLSMSIKEDWSELLSKREQDMVNILTAVARHQGCSADAPLAD